MTKHMDNLSIPDREPRWGDARPGQPDNMLLRLRDDILQSLRDQFATKVDAIALKSHETLDAFLLDLANNIAQGMA